MSCTLFGVLRARCPPLDPLRAGALAGLWLAWVMVSVVALWGQQRVENPAGRIDRTNERIDQVVESQAALSERIASHVASGGHGDMMRRMAEVEQGQKVLRDDMTLAKGAALLGPALMMLFQLLHLFGFRVTMAKGER